MNAEVVIRPLLGRLARPELRQIRRFQMSQQMQCLTLVGRLDATIERALWGA